MNFEELSLRVSSLLRHSGIADVSRPALVGTIAAACVLVCLGIWHFWPRPVQGYSLSPSEQAQSEQAETAAAPQNILVDIEGAVCSPGLYSLPAGARVGDAVSAAGGLAADAVPAQVNLARKLEDGEQVYVASAEEQRDVPGPESQARSFGESATGTSQSGASSGKVNINTASSEELQALSGIGPSLAERIIDYREKNGRFSSVEDLQNVSGIGKTRFANIQDKICV